ncbi:MAG: signal peptidase I [Gemmiger sp.]|nr:signal peptidase I [Gemmiger sp.]
MDEQQLAAPLPDAVKIIEKKRYRLAARAEFLGLLRRLAMVAVGGWVLFYLVFGFAVVKGQGMYPRLSDGDLTFFYRLETSFAVGDILAFQQNGAQAFGRIVAMPGDTVNFTEDGQLVVNGNMQEEEIFFQTTTAGRATQYPLALGKNEVFVLGDDRPYAVDSRDYGAVHLQNIQGVVLCIFRSRGL